MQLIAALRELDCGDEGSKLSVLGSEFNSGFGSETSVRANMTFESCISAALLIFTWAYTSLRGNTFNSLCVGAVRIKNSDSSCVTATVSFVTGAFEAVALSSDLRGIVSVDWLSA
jgi:hypothetical protein